MISAIVCYSSAKGDGDDDAKPHPPLKMEIGESQDVYMNCKLI